MAIVRLRADELRQALAAGALSLHYQPQVEIAGGKLAGVEAYVRWPHPVHGMIGPSDIIPIVDQAGLHVEFDRWVIGAICMQAQTWKAGKVPVPVVAANVWAQTLQRPDALKLMDAIAETRADPKMIELELPKGSGADASLVKALTAIKALGVRLASEDLATGVRASGQLRFDTLKIPYPVSRDFTANRETIRAVVAEAKETGARVVADSVETPEQEAGLAELGVAIVQGYLYGPQVVPAELRTLITRP